MSYDFLLNTQEDWHFEHQVTHDFLLNHFGVHSLDGFGLRGMVAGINAAGALLSYLQNHLSLPVDQIKEIQPYSLLQYMSMDRSTQRNLELTDSLKMAVGETLFWGC